jgi:hypothetical protein
VVASLMPDDWIMDRGEVKAAFWLGIRLEIPSEVGPGMSHPPRPERDGVRFHVPR